MPCTRKITEVRIDRFRRLLDCNNSRPLVHDEDLYGFCRSIDFPFKMKATVDQLTKTTVHLVSLWVLQRPLVYV
jgi:hypothetical protein